MHSNTDAHVKHTKLEFSSFVDPPPAKLNLNFCAATPSPQIQCWEAPEKIDTQGLPQLCIWGEGGTTKIEVKFRGGLIECRQRTRERREYGSGDIRIMHGERYEWPRQR